MCSAQNYQNKNEILFYLHKNRHGIYFVFKGVFIYYLKEIPLIV